MTSTMDTFTLLATATSAVVFGAAGAAAAWWWQSRSLRALRKRLEQSEQARAAANERSRQARAQIAQLQQDLAIAKAAALPVTATRVEAPPVESAQQRRDRLSKQLDDATLVLPRHEAPADGFADTQPFV